MRMGRHSRKAIERMEKIASMSHDDAIAFLKAERAAHAPLDLDQTALEHGSMMPADPTMDEFETCLRVLRWMRDTDNGLHESWTIPLTHVCGAVRACVETLNTHNAPSSATRPT